MNLKKRMKKHTVVWYGTLSEYFSLDNYSMSHQIMNGMDHQMSQQGLIFGNTAPFQPQQYQQPQAQTTQYQATGYQQPSNTWLEQPMQQPYMDRVAKEYWYIPYPQPQKQSQFRVIGYFPNKEEKERESKFFKWHIEKYLFPIHPRKKYLLPEDRANLTNTNRFKWSK